MRALRELARLAEAGALKASDLTLNMRRMILPGGSNIETGGLFSISSSQPLGYYVGRLPESWTIVQYLTPSTIGNNIAFNLGVSRDIASLISYVYKRRIIVADEMQLTSPERPGITFLPIYHMVNSRLYAPIATDPDAIWATLSEVLSISNDDEFHAVSGSVRLYHSALAIAEYDYGAAYLLLVSALESLASVFWSTALEFDDWSEASSWNEWIATAGLGPAISRGLRDRLFNRKHVQLRQRFIGLAEQAANEEFWNLPWERCLPEIELGRQGYRAFHARADPELTPAAIPKERLRSLLASIYDHRSRFVHGGAAFPADVSLDFPQEIEVQLDPWTGEERRVSVPSFSWFERLSRFAIQMCIDSAQKVPGYTLPDVVVSPATILDR